MPHTRQVKIHRALWINPYFLVHPVRLGEMLKFLWWSLKMFLSTDDVSTCVLSLITISSARFLDVLQNAGCVNSTQTRLFNISSYILNKSNDSEIKRLIKTKQLSLKKPELRPKTYLGLISSSYISVWVSEWVRWAALSLAFKSNWHEGFPVSSPHNPAPNARVGNTVHGGKLSEKDRSDRVFSAEGPWLKSCDRDTPCAVSLALRVSAFERWVLRGSSMWM